jgi:hypothetical protein
MSATVAITGYMVTSGSKPRLKDKAENAIVIGEINKIDTPMVELATTINEKKSMILAPQRNTPKSDAPNPTTMLLTRVNVTIE